MKTLICTALLLATTASFAQKGVKTSTITRVREGKKIVFRVKGDIRMVVNKEYSELLFVSAVDNGRNGLRILEGDKVTIKQDD